MGPLTGQPQRSAVGQPTGAPRGAPVWVALLILGLAVGIFVATLRPPEKLRLPGRKA